MKAVRAVDQWAKAGVYYVRTEAMVLGFGVRLEGEFSEDAPDSEYVLVLDDKHGTDDKKCQEGQLQGDVSLLAFVFHVKFQITTITLNVAPKAELSRFPNPGTYHTLLCSPSL